MSGSPGLLFLSSALAALSGAVMPGPLFTAVVKDSLKRGPAAGPLYIGGHALLELALFVAVAAGLGPFLALPAVVAVVGLVGGTVMAFMAVTMLRSVKGLRLEGVAGSDGGTAETEGGEVATGTDRGGWKGMFLSGAVLSLSNPYWTVWWATVGLGFIAMGMAAGPAGIVAVYLGHILGDLGWYAALSFLASSGRRFLDEARYRVLVGACALALGGFGLFFLIRSPLLFLSLNR